jgi:hypothetical protein
MSDTLYDVGFQCHLLTCMLRNPDLWRKASESLRVSDFGPNYLQFVYEVARNYVERYGELPSSQTFFLVLENTMNNGDPNINTTVSPMEHMALGTFLDRYGAYTPEEADVQFCMKSLPEFWSAVRWAGVALEGGSSYDKLQAAKKIAAGMGSVGERTFKMVNGLDEIPEEECSTGKRYGLGIMSVDAAVAGGIMRKQMMLIGAGTGVGKTTGMTACTAANTMIGAASLYITLEMTASRIGERYHGILGGIPANLFKKPRSQWPDCYKKRIAAMLTPGFKLKPFMTICDMSAMPHCVADVDEAIKHWKDDVTDQGLNADEVCTTVYVDWLDRMDPKGLMKVKKDTSEERMSFHICEGLYQLANKHDLCITAATQVKPEAKGKEVITAKDIAWGFSKLHLMDLGIGLAPIIPPADAEPTGLGVRSTKAKSKAGPVLGEVTGYDEIPRGLPECDRDLNVCFLKTRDTAAVDTFVKVYQDPTLRMWSSKNEALKRKEAIENDPYDGIREFMV